MSYTKPKKAISVKSTTKKGKKKYPKFKENTSLTDKAVYEFFYGDDEYKNEFPEMRGIGDLGK